MSCLSWGSFLACMPKNKTRNNPKCIYSIQFVALFNSISWYRLRRKIHNQYCLPMFACSGASKVCKESWRVTTPKLQLLFYLNHNVSLCIVCIFIKAKMVRVSQNTWTRRIRSSQVPLTFGFRGISWPGVETQFNKNVDISSWFTSMSSTMKLWTEPI